MQEADGERDDDEDAPTNTKQDGEQDDDGDATNTRQDNDQDTNDPSGAASQIDSSGIFHHGVTTMFKGLKAGVGSKSTSDDRHQTKTRTVTRARASTMTAANATRPGCTRLGEQSRTV